MGCGLSKAHSNPEVLVSHGNARTTVQGSAADRPAPSARLAAGPHRRGDGDLPQVRQDLDRPLRRRRRGRSAGPVLPPAHEPGADRAEVEARSWSCARRSVAARTGSAPTRRAGPDRLADPGPPRVPPLAAWTRSPGGDPLQQGHRGPLRTRPARRAGPHGREEDRPDPRRRRLARPRPGAAATTRDRTTKVGYDYVHSLVDDHSRLAYSEVLADEKGPTCAASWPARSPTSPPTASPGSSE